MIIYQKHVQIKNSLFKFKSPVYILIFRFRFVGVSLIIIIITVLLLGRKIICPQSFIFVFILKLYF